MKQINLDERFLKEENNMKKNWIYKLGFLVIMLTLITTSLVSGTYAKYTTEYTATETVTVAKWVADFEYNDTAISDDFEFNLLATEDTGVLFGGIGVDSTSYIAPGTSGSFKVDYATNGTQVARDVDITMDVSELDPAPTYLKFYLGTDATTGIDITAAVLLGTTGNLLDKTYGPNAVDGDGTINVYWEWPFESGVADPDPLVDTLTAADALDTADGTAISPASGTVTITFTATQLNTLP